jgi:hypothetical protein
MIPILQWLVRSMWLIIINVQIKNMLIFCYFLALGILAEEPGVAFKVQFAGLAVLLHAPLPALAVGTKLVIITLQVAKSAFAGMASNGTWVPSVSLPAQARSACDANFFGLFRAVEANWFLLQPITCRQPHWKAYQRADHVRIRVAFVAGHWGYWKAACACLTITWVGEERGLKMWTNLLILLYKIILKNILTDKKLFMNK